MNRPGLTKKEVSLWKALKKTGFGKRLIDEMVALRMEACHIPISQVPFERKRFRRFTMKFIEGEEFNG